VPQPRARREDARQRDAIVQQLQEKIAAGGVRDQLKNGARRYLKLTGATPEIDLKKVQEDARYDGKWVLRTTTSLPPEQVALAYRGLWRVENAFRTLKTPLELGRCSTPAKPASAGTCKPACSPTPSCASSRTDSTPPASTSTPRTPCSARTGERRLGGTGPAQECLSRLNQPRATYSARSGITWFRYCS
jgi:hypothetical protein